jgi:hypothetical protein
MLEIDRFLLAQECNFGREHLLLLWPGTSTCVAARGAAEEGRKVLESVQGTSARYFVEWMFRSVHIARREILILVLLCPLGRGVTLI